MDEGSSVPLDQAAVISSYAYDSRTQNKLPKPVYILGYKASTTWHLNPGNYVILLHLENAGDETKYVLKLSSTQNLHTQ